jgi:enamine deaminase RidA (YjgF/YER057c/UK114 family)
MDSVEKLLLSEHVLAVFEFSQDETIGSEDPRYINTGLTLIGEESLREVWYSQNPVTSGVDYSNEMDVCWASSDQVLLVSVRVDDPVAEDVQLSSYQVYQRLLDVIAEKGYPHIVRAWNYMADINAGEGDEERYKRFCSGRYEAFIEHNHDLHQFPAACALGHQGGPMVIYLLAAMDPPQHFENPQQLSAYHYPREYGPRAPSFARAALKRWSNNFHIYISGTASIIGHSSLHQGDVAQQLAVTFDNIERLLAHIQGISSVANPLQSLMLKVYVRNVDDCELIKAAVENQYGASIQAIYLHADICRQELGVEIDGLSVVSVADA